MNWKGKKIVTIGDLMRLGIDQCSTPEEAQEFMRLYRQDSPDYADENIGYLSGYYSPEKMARIQQWFQVAHPIFGRSVPTVDEALKAGQDAAKQKKGQTHAQ